MSSLWTILPQQRANLKLILAVPASRRRTHNDIAPAIRLDAPLQAIKKLVFANLGPRHGFYLRCRGSDIKPIAMHSQVVRALWRPVGHQDYSFGAFGCRPRAPHAAQVPR